MKFHNWHFNWIFNRDEECVILFGFATGRVHYLPEAKWLYSFRLFFGLFKIEILWATGYETVEELFE